MSTFKRNQKTTYNDACDDDDDEHDGSYGNSNEDGKGEQQKIP